ncbi:MAG: zinc dependent phospholipase C family protein [Ignavibacteria bacterium]
MNRQKGRAMERSARWRRLLWLPPLLLTAADAWAWGLFTHVYFAQALLWLVPLADPRFRKAMLRLPRLVLAGACLPDLALTDVRARTPLFESSHDWETAARLLASARSEEEMAVSLGYACHILTDIFAHNHFVPAHELVWFDAHAATHAACEWAMDHHIRREICTAPADVLRSERAVLGACVSASFGCSESQALDALAMLAGAARRFSHYLSHTTRHLRQMDRLIAGERPRWVANPCRHAARAALADVPRHLVRVELPLPADVFA